jgi:hypothetical protein
MSTALRPIETAFSSHRRDHLIQCEVIVRLDHADDEGLMRIQARTFPLTPLGRRQLLLPCIRDPGNPIASTFEAGGLTSRKEDARIVAM